jgi:hypothetical protein
MGRGEKGVAQVATSQEDLRRNDPVEAAKAWRAEGRDMARRTWICSGMTIATATITATSWEQSSRSNSTSINIWLNGFTPK